ncbi:MAG TPA: methyl-coenzyme M reductase operon protein D [Methanoregulaceae archaeon]|nr:MAG: methyl-coenzyme M reductase operon protein D [Methanolinea sp.]HON81656.1 methyl-coenzyme M reductase operon protein D [Methanoregulaceae archaeon]HPD10463.1 methyl-coenzyme M reductase operon protein D [Methanoregulaceae archaeon]HRT15405.1 methyl-coenzyme M reductase operon protein D [Methanoregulaceae archaeon]HRU31055.1 methyl-coenzyme M reductase operon protein D [Methanoregulaceae archaeon]
MTYATYPQVRIVSERLMNPETTERVMNLILAVGGIRRVVLNGPRIPPSIPYGPARGVVNPHTMRKTISLGGQEVELEVHVGTILLELESEEYIPKIKAACDEAFTTMSYSLKEGRFMKTEPTIVDYAKYGPDADKAIIGITDPGSRSGPIIIQGTK